jgi:hypothetical protein
MKKILTCLAAILLALAVCAPAKAVWGWGGPHYIVYYGPVGYPGGVFGPYWPYGPNYVVISAAGKVEIKTKAVGNRIYVDGGFAGMTGTLRKFWLKAGTHTIRIEDEYGKQVYRQRIEVLAGKKLRIYPDEKPVKP